MHIKVNEALGEPAGIEYTPQSLQKTVENFGFKVTDRKELKSTYLEQYHGLGTYITKRVQRVSDEKLREELLQEMERIDRDGKKYGMRSIPHHVVYAIKPYPVKQRDVQYSSLKELYETVHHRECLGY